MVGGWEFGVAVQEAPVAAGVAVDVGDADGHGSERAPVDLHLAAFEADGVGERAAICTTVVRR